MADDVDRAEALIRRTVDASLAEVRARPSLIPIGTCYNCEDPVPQHHIFCSSECSVDHRHRIKRLKDLGR